jgi:hypothetical protein
MDRLPEFIGFAFFEVHRFFTDSAGWYPIAFVGHNDLLGETIPTLALLQFEV